MKDLFSAMIIVDNCKHGVHIYDNLKMFLIRDNKGDLYLEDEYRTMIKEYDSLLDSDKIYSKIRIDELFTKQEIEQMRPWFEKLSGTRFKIEKEKLPVASGDFPVSAIPVGGNNGCYQFNLHNEYPLKFNVEGYYEISGLKPVALNEKEFQRRRKEISVTEENVEETKSSRCQIKGCKNKSTIKFHYSVSRYDLGLKGYEGCSLYFCAVFTCDRHSFKTNRKIFYKYLDSFAREQQDEHNH